MLGDLLLRQFSTCLPGTRGLHFAPVAEDGDRHADDKAIEHRIAPTLATIANFELGKPSMTVHLHQLTGCLRTGLSLLQRIVSPHHLVAHLLQTPEFRHKRIDCLVKFERHVPVHGQQVLKSRTIGRIVFSHGGTQVHQFHFHLVHFQDIDITFLETFVKERIEFFGILQALPIKRFQLVQTDEVEAKLLGPQQDVAPEDGLLEVEGATLQLAILPALGIKRREINALCHLEFDFRTDSVLLAKLAGIGHRRVFEVVFISHVQLLGPRILLAGLEFTVVLFNAFQHSLDASGLCMQPGKPTKESDSQEYLFHCSVFDWVVKHCLRFIILYTMGMMNPLRNVDVSSPPRITLAIGL